MACRRHNDMTYVMTKDSYVMIMYKPNFFAKEYTQTLTCTLFSIHVNMALLGHNPSSPFSPPSPPFQHLTSVLDIVYHPSAPRVSLPVGDPPPAKPLGHDLWCEVTWGHVTVTLQEWLRHLRGLQVRTEGRPLWKDKGKLSTKHQEPLPGVCNSVVLRSTASCSKVGSKINHLL